MRSLETLRGRCALLTIEAVDHVRFRLEMNGTLRALSKWLDRRRRRNGRRTNRLVNITLLAVMDSLSEWEWRHRNDKPAAKIVPSTDPELCAALVASCDPAPKPRPREIIDAGWLQHTAWRMRDVADEIDRRLHKPAPSGSVQIELHVVRKESGADHGFIE